LKGQLVLNVEEGKGGIKLEGKKRERDGLLGKARVWKLICEKKRGKTA